MKTLLPIRTESQIEDGALIKALEYCKKNCCSGVCQRFYSNISEKEYNCLLICPHGMSVYPAYNNGTLHYFTCFRSKDNYDRQKAKGIANPPNKPVYNPLMDSEAILGLINFTISNENERASLAEQRASIESISHEVKKLNAQIKDRSEVILQSYELDSEDALSLSDKHSLAEKIKTIYVSSSVIHGRFILIDYEKNPGVLTKGAKFDCNIYKKFEKMKIIFSNYLGRKIPIRITGNSFECIRAYPSFEMIPLLIIDNAIKYSSEGNIVEVQFANGPNELTVKVISFSPTCSGTEISRIFDKGFRGNNAKKHSDGSGIGLFFVKMLCDLHNIEIGITSAPTVTQVNGIDHSQFVVTLQFKNTYQKNGG